MRKFRALAAGLAAVLVLTTTPVYASADVITLLQYPVERTVKSNTRVLTLEEAFAMAARNNSSIDALNDSLTFIEQQRRSLEIDMSNAWRFGHGLQDFSAESARRAIRSIDTAMGNASANRQIIEATSRFLVLNTLNMYNALEIDSIVLRETIELQMAELNHVTLRNSLGMASNADVTSARQDLDRSRASLRALEIGLSSQRTSLNYLLRLPSDTDVLIKRELSLEPRNISTDVRNIQSYIDRQIAIDPSIAVLRRQLDAAQSNYDAGRNWFQNAQPAPGMPTNPQANSTDRASLLNSLNAASRDLRDGIDNLRQNILLGYNNLRQLEEQREMWMIDLQRAHDAHDNAVASLAAGMITEHDVNMARLAILNAEAAILGNALAYENARFTFETPFLIVR